MWEKAARNSFTIFTGAMLSGLFVMSYRVLVIRSLSVEDYALFAVLTTLFTWISVFSHFDLYSAVSKYVSEYAAKGRLGEAAMSYHHAFVMALVLSCSGIVIGLLSSFRHSIGAGTLLIFFMGNIPFALLTVSDGVLKGTGRFTSSAGVNVIVGLSRIIIFLPLIFIMDVISIDQALITFSLAMFVPFAVMQMMMRKIGFHAPKIKSIRHTSVYKNLFDYSKWVALTDLSNTGILLANTYILSTRSLADAAVFNVVIVLYMIVQIGYGSITSVLIPQISHIAAQGRPIRLMGLREFVPLILATLVIVVIIYLFPAKEKILSMLLNNSTYSHALNYFLILLLVSPLKVFSMAGKGITQGLGNTKTMASVAFISLAVDLALIVPLYAILGLIGVMLAMVAAALVEFLLTQAAVRRILASLPCGQVDENPLQVDVQRI